MSLFNYSPEGYTLASGKKSHFLIDCNAFTKQDWDALAFMASKMLPPFCSVLGVPRGGIPFSDALDQYATANKDHRILVAEDVCTSGSSMARVRDSDAEEHGLDPERDYLGVCVFLRGIVCPPWVMPILEFDEALKL